MGWKNTTKKYGVITKTFHWAVAFLIFGQFFLGFRMGSIAHDFEGAVWGYTRMEWFQFHQSFGVLLILFVVGRITWRCCSTLPEWAEGLSPFERKYSHYVERVLYWLMLLAPLTGLLLVMTKADNVYFFGLLIPSVVPHNETLRMFFGLGHGITRMGLILFVFLHLGLIIKHQFINKDRLMNRMLPFSSQTRDE